MIDCGVVPFFLQFLRIVDNNGALQVEAARVIEKVTLYGTLDHLRYVINAGAIPILIGVLTSTNEDVRSLAAKTLGNLVCDDAEDAESILASGALPALIQVTQNSTNVDLIRNVTSAIYKLFSTAELPSIEEGISVVPFLNQLLYSQDCQTVLDACQTLSYLSGEDEYIPAILALEKPVLPQLIELLGNTSPKVIIAALKVIGHLLNDETPVLEGIKDSLINQQNILPRLLWLLGHPDQKIHKVTCWVLSRFSGSSKELQALIDAAIFPKLLELIKSSDSRTTLQPLEFHVRRFIVIILFSAVECGTAEQVWYLVTEGFVSPLCILLQQVVVMEHAQKTVEANASSEEQEEEAEEEEEDDNEEEIKRLSLLLVARRILRILDKMLSIANDNKNLEFIVHSICDGNGTMNTIENLSYYEFNDFDHSQNCLSY